MFVDLSTAADGRVRVALVQDDGERTDDDGEGGHATEGTA
jgi:hypothetical protein